MIGQAYCRLYLCLKSYQRSLDYTTTSQYLWRRLYQMLEQERAMEPQADARWAIFLARDEVLISARIRTLVNITAEL